MSMLVIFGRPAAPEILTVADEDTLDVMAAIAEVYAHDLSGLPMIPPIRMIDWDHNDDEEPRCPLRRRQQLLAQPAGS